MGILLFFMFPLILEILCPTTNLKLWYELTTSAVIEILGGLGSNLDWTTN